jgi:aryl-alcohol dehydrogenase-like predicted oxidoreductase
MIKQSNLGGTFTFPNTALTVNRMGYGAMQLAGRDGDKVVWGPPRDVDEAIAVLREAVAAGVNHIDTSDYYGPHVTNQIIRRALHPYPKDLVIVTKVGARRGSDGSWPHARSRQEILEAVHDNMRHLGREVLQIVNLRMGGLMTPDDEPLEEPLAALAELKQQGLIQHIGLSTVSPRQLDEAKNITEIVCVQNFYNVAQRGDDPFIDALAAQGIGYVPYFPLGGFTPLQSSRLDEIAASLGTTPMQVALAWLLHRSPNILLIPGTSSLRHLRENLQAATVELPKEALVQLDAVGMVPSIELGRAN